MILIEFYIEESSFKWFEELGYATVQETARRSIS